MLLIVFSGVSGTGKSTLSNIIGEEHGIPVFSIDLIKAFFLKVGFAKDGWPLVREIGYQLLISLADSQLKLGQSVILDGVFARQEFRAPLFEMAERYKATLRIIECVCSDPEIHECRVLNRKRLIEHLPPIDWLYVQTVKKVFVNWEMAHLILDSANSVDENISSVRSYILE